MARPRRARDRLRELYEEGGRTALPRGQAAARLGGYAYARLAGGREMFATGAELAERAGPDVPPRPESVAGYRRQRVRMQAGRARAAETLARRYAKPVSPSERLGKFLGWTTEEAHLYRRDPAARAAMEAHLGRQGRLGELERREGGAFTRLGMRLGVTKRGQDVGRQVAGARELGRQKRAIDVLGQREKDRVSREKIAGEAAEAKAGSAVGKAETRTRERAEAARTKAAEAKDKAEQTRLQREYDRLSKDREALVKREQKLKDIVAAPQSTAADKAHHDAAVKKLMEFDRKKHLDKAYEKLQGFKPTATTEEPTEAPGEETVTPEMPGGETVTPQMARPEAPAPGAPEYRTSSEVITAIRGGEIDMAAPGGEDIFYSLDPNAQEEVRAWLRRNGYLE